MATEGRRGGGVEMGRGLYPRKRRDSRCMDMDKFAYIIVLLNNKQLVVYVLYLSVLVIC